MFSDLRPYVCLEENCVDAGKEFERQHGWLAHMRDAHWIIYNCPSGCEKRFQSSIECEEHVNSVHPGTVSSPNLKAKIKLYSTDVEDDSVLACRLCGQTQNSIVRFRHHVGGHLEQLSLFTLPPVESDDGDQSDHDISEDPNISEQGDGDGGGLEADISHQDVPSSSILELRVSSSSQEHRRLATSPTSTDFNESGKGGVTYKIRYVWTCHNCGFGELDFNLTPGCVSCSHYYCDICEMRRVEEEE